MATMSLAIAVCVLAGDEGEVRARVQGLVDLSGLEVGGDQGGAAGRVIAPEGVCVPELGHHHLVPVREVGHQLSLSHSALGSPYRAPR